MTVNNIQSELVEKLLDSRAELTEFIHDAFNKEEELQQLRIFKQETEDRYQIQHIGAKKSLEEKELLLDSIRQAIAHFNHDRHYEGMAVLQLALKGEC